jgi:hypothetical protein
VCAGIERDRDFLGRFDLLFFNGKRNNGTEVKERKKRRGRQQNKISTEYKEETSRLTLY